MARLYLSDYTSYHENRIVELERQLQEMPAETPGGFRLFKIALIQNVSLPKAKRALENLPTFDEAIETYQVENSRVLWLIEKHFNLEEIKTLTFELGMDYDNLPGLEKSSKTRELILTSERSDKLKTLITNARRRRPNAEWESCLYTEGFLE